MKEFFTIIMFVFWFFAAGCNARAAQKTFREKKYLWSILWFLLFLVASAEFLEIPQQYIQSIS